MKLIRKLLFRVLLGVAVLAVLAQVVDEGFARAYASPVLGAFALWGLISGIRAASRDKKEKQQIAQALQEVERSREQRNLWASEARKQAVEAERICRKNNGETRENPLFTPEYEAEDCLEDIVLELMQTADVQARVRLAAEQLGEEADAQ